MLEDASESFALVDGGEAGLVHLTLVLPLLVTELLQQHLGPQEASLVFGTHS